MTPTEVQPTSVRVRLTSVEVQMTSIRGQMMSLGVRLTWVRVQSTSVAGQVPLFCRLVSNDNTTAPRDPPLHYAAMDYPTVRGDCV